MSVAPIRQLIQGIGAIISYYDGSTLLGKKNVPKGKDVLHPSITMPTKSGYTFVGWATSNSEDDWVSTLVATGQPMSLYAIYASNSKTVVSGSISGGTYPAYSLVSSDETYATGTFGCRGEKWYQPGTGSTSVSFTLDKKFYQTATVTLGRDCWGDGSQTFDGSSFSNGTSKTINSGSHTIWASATLGTEGAWSLNAVGVISLVLTNPTAWT